MAIKINNVCFDLKERKFKHLHEVGRGAAVASFPTISVSVKTEMIKQQSDNEGTARVFLSR